MSAHNRHGGARIRTAGRARRLIAAITHARMVPLHGAKSQHRGLARHLAREYMTSRLEDRLFRADDGQPDGIEDVPELDRAFNPQYYKWLDRK